MKALNLRGLLKPGFDIQGPLHRVDDLDGTAERFRAFAAEHGGPATAVVNYLGRERARVVLVGGDGIFTDAVLSSVAAAESVCAAAGVTVESWNRELNGRVRTTPADRRRMAGTGR